jgi:septation ring formation regulator EzrA
MLEWLKRIFAKEEEKRQLTLKPEELPAYVKREQQRREKAFNDYLHAWQKEWKQTLATCDNAIRELEVAELRNPNIPERHKAIMTGNRQEFVRRVRGLLGGIKMPSSLEESRSLMQSLHTDVGQFVRSTAKQQAILSEFFRVELTAVLNGIGAVEQRVAALGAELARLFPPSWTAFEDAVDDRMAEAGRGIGLKETLARLEASIGKEHDALDKVVADIKRVEESDEHKAVAALRQQLSRAHETVRDANATIVHELQQLDDAISRFARQSTFPLAFFHNLAAAPLDALATERDRFSEMVGQIRKGLLDGTIRITERKKDRALEACDHLLGAFLDEQVARAAEARKEEAGIIRSINESGVVARLAHLRRQEADARERIQRMTLEAKEAERKLSAVDVPQAEQKAVNAAHEMGIELTLSQ